MKKIAVVTGTRAEYGLLKPLISALKQSSETELKLVVTGMHLMPVFGNTYKEIEVDGFNIDAKVDDGLDGDSAKAIGRSMGKSLAGFSEVFDNLRPDLLIVLGDRTEILMAATAAIIASIPIAHIHGGETTEGAYDEFIRHAVSKMSYLHFTSCETYRKRVIQLGESPDRVFNVGALGVDSIKALKLLDKNEFEQAIEFKLAPKAALITFHPVTLENQTQEVEFQELLDALHEIPDMSLIFTKPNSDKGGGIIIKMIDDYVRNNYERAVAYASLGQLRYLSALQYVDFVIGNSSSGILEAPYFGIPTVNIGNRQKGRISPESVIHCKAEKSSISKAINDALSNDFINRAKNQKQIYGDGNATDKIIQVLNETKKISNEKKFFDLNPDCFEKL